jgi:UDP-glucose 4-epimerase
MRVLITGKNSFVGNYAGPYLVQKGFKVEYISLKDSSWKNHDFSVYNVLIHVAGIAHVSYQKRDSDLYDQVNHQLTKRVAEKAKKEGVFQFIFLSSMIVYSPKVTKIDETTLPQPKGPYALSKWMAEDSLKPLESQDFKVSILRPSMIYGPGNKGNIPKLIKLIKILPLFPKFKNQRSFLYVGHLAEAMYQIILNRQTGTFHLADEKAVSTYDLVKTIAKHLNKRMFYTSLFNPLIKFLRNKVMVFNKLFSDYYYDSSLTKHSFDYHLYHFDETIQATLIGESHG